MGRTTRARAWLAAALVGAGSFAFAPPSAAGATPAPGPVLSRPGSGPVSNPGGDLGRLVEKADAVFTGSVVTSSVETVGTGRKARRLRQYTVQVDRLYQGKVAQERVLVTSALGKQCGYGVIPTGRPWVFVVHGRGAKFFGNICGGTGSATEAYIGRVERLLGAGSAVAPAQPQRAPLQYVSLDVPEPTPWTRLLAPGAGVTLLGLLGLVLFRRRPARD